MELAIEGSESSSSMERKFTIGPYGIYLSLIPQWIKVLFYDKGFVSTEGCHGSINSLHKGEVFENLE